MKVAIIGGGFSGLTAGYYLSKSGHSVTIFEKDKVLGGLANGFKEPGWKWHLEKAYHHWFTNDLSILSLINDLRLNDKLIIKRPVTANFWKGKAYQFDDPVNFLKYPGLTAVDKIRTGMLLAFLKLNPFWQPLEKTTAEKFGRLVGGGHAWNSLWQPLMEAKFDKYAGGIAASWLWARIKKRSPSLGYIVGGFHTLVTKLAGEIKANDGKIYTGTSVPSVKIISDKKFIINNNQFDKVLLTVPTFIAAKLVSFPESFINPPLSIPHLWAQTLILETDKPIIDRVYWLNVLDRKFPFLAVVAHTNFMDKANYGGHHLAYIGNYLPTGHPYLSMTKEQLLHKFKPYINRLSTDKFSIINSFLFTAPFAQPVQEVNYSKIAPPLITPLPNVYLANLDSIFPWDRGTNYAVELGKRAADKIMF